MGIDGTLSRRELLREGLTLAAVATIAAAALRAWRDRNRYDDLDGIISFSARIIAAYRALESELPAGALFEDPMALHLAGPRAMAYARKRAEATMRTPAQGFTRRQLRVGFVAIRTLWFDRQLRDATTLERHPAPYRLSLTAADGVIRVRAQAVTRPTQVVLLGAGMDTRAWRQDLHLPGGISWFEIDREDVLKAKRTVMLRIGASFDSDDEHCDHPLRASRYAALAADLDEPGWSEELIAQGFDPGQATVWVAEGLLMYLQPAAVGAMLQEMAEVSAAGSVFLGLSVTEEMLDKMRQKRNRSTLLSKFIYGCPSDPTRMLSRVGWHLLTAETRGDMWDPYGIPPHLRPADLRSTTSATGSSPTLFLVAVVDVPREHVSREHRQEPLTLGVGDN